MGAEREFSRVMIQLFALTLKSRGVNTTSLCAFAYYELLADLNFHFIRTIFCLLKFSLHSESRNALKWGYVFPMYHNGST